MIQNQMYNQMAAQQQSALGIAGLMGYGGHGDPLSGQILGATRYAPEKISVINEMRADVREWLKDWDK